MIDRLLADHDADDVSDSTVENVDDVRLELRGELAELCVEMAEARGAFATACPTASS